MLATLSKRSTLAPLQRLRPQRVCLIKTSALGDIVNALPVLSALRARWPEARIAWVVNESFRDVLEGHPALDEVIPYDRSGSGPTPSGVRRMASFVRRLSGGGFDVTVDLQGLLRSGVMALATGAKVRVGLADAREGAARFYTHAVPPPGPRSGVHAVERLLRLAAVFGADVAAPRFVVPLGAEERRWARDVLSAIPRPRLVLCPGTSWKTKRWPSAHFTTIARRAHETRGAGLVVVGSRADVPLVEAVRSRLDPIPVLDLCGRTTLRQLAAVAAESDVVLSNDSGPLHLACAAGARVVGLYTCTNPVCHGPFGPDTTVIASRVWCAGSYVKQCARLDCMNELSPERVWPQVAMQLDLACSQRSFMHSGLPEP